jgi:hypothetical protein
MMIAQDGQIQEFVTCGREFDSYGDKWMRRLEDFQKNSPKALTVGLEDCRGQENP